MGLYFHHQIQPQLVVVSALAQPLRSSCSYFSALLQWYIGHLVNWGIHLSVSYLFAFSCCSWGFQGKNNGMVCHSLLQWTTFCQALSGTCSSAAQCSWMPCWAPWLSHWWSSLSIWTFTVHWVSVNVQPGIKAKALLEWLGRGSGEGWSWCWRTPRMGGHPGLITAADRPGTPPLPRSLRANQPLRSGWYANLSAATVTLGTGGAGHYPASTSNSGLIFAKPLPRPPTPLQATTMLSCGDTCYRFSTKYFSRSQWNWKAFGLVFTIFLRIFTNSKFI